MKLVYIAGPFRAKTNYQIKLNVRRAEAAGLKVCKLDAMAVIPHKNTEEFQGELPDAFWLEGTLALLRRCDALLAIDGWERSSGTRAEIVEANRLGIPVFYEIGDVEEWLKPGVLEAAVNRLRDAPRAISAVEAEYARGVAPVNTFFTPDGVEPDKWRGQK